MFSVIIETSQGDITVDLFYKECPLACTNFLKLCKIKFFNCMKIHKIIQNYAFIFGDPSGKGKQGDSIWGFEYNLFSIFYYFSFNLSLEKFMDLQNVFFQMNFMLF